MDTLVIMIILSIIITLWVLFPIPMLIICCTGSIWLYFAMKGAPLLGEDYEE